VEEQEEEEEEEEGEEMSPALQRKVDALQKVQESLETLTQEYKAERAALEKKFAAKKAELYNDRKQIITGEKEIAPEEGAEADAEEEEGIRAFWLGCLSRHPIVGNVIQEEDEDALEALTDITCDISEDFTTFTLKFHFAENDFFTNNVLTKTYEVTADLFDEQPNLTKVDGCDINWKEGKNLCYHLQSIQVKQMNKRNGHKRTIIRIVPILEAPKPSFFNFFQTPVNEIEAKNVDEEEDPSKPPTKLSLDEDYDIAHIIRTSIIPEAILYFTGAKDKEIKQMFLVSYSCCVHIPYDKFQC
jgi:nucleosome assembly protein 1-like 1